jgi:hypothetical protein
VTLSTRNDPAGSVAPAGEHRLGTVQGTALFVGAVLGPGVLTLPHLAAAAAGPASILAWAALLALSVPVALTFASLGARYADGGGVATFAGRAFGPRIAVVVGWWFYGSPSRTGSGWTRSRGRRRPAWPPSRSSGRPRWFAAAPRRSPRPHARHRGDRLHRPGAVVRRLPPPAGDAGGGRGTGSATGPVNRNRVRGNLRRA